MTSPISQRDTNDIGDSVLRKFNYQHAYGAILAIRMIIDPDWKCKAIWCEQHEDLIVEFDDVFDGYQIKTRKSELGAWKLNHDALLKSIARFIFLDTTFPNQFRNFYFVSNTCLFDSSSEQDKHMSPLPLIQAARKLTSHLDLKEQSLKSFKLIESKLTADPIDLFNTLQKINFILGPSERGYEDEITVRHTANLPNASSLGQRILLRITTSLINTIAMASSLQSSSPSRDWLDLSKDADKDPYLHAKKISPEIVMLCVEDVMPEIIGFPISLQSIDLKNVGNKVGILEKKMLAGGLGARYEVMRRRSLLAEQHLLDYVTRGDNHKEKLSQIENIVLGECDEANLRASLENENFGPAMLIDVQNRLQDLAENNSKKVAHTSYEILIGVSALLTAECKVWWSEVFDLDESK